MFLFCLQFKNVAQRMTVILHYISQSILSLYIPQRLINNFIFLHTTTSFLFSFFFLLFLNSCSVICVRQNALPTSVLCFIPGEMKKTWAHSVLGALYIFHIPRGYKTHTVSIYFCLLTNDPGRFRPLLIYSSYLKIYFKRSCFIPLCIRSMLSFAGAN